MGQEMTEFKVRCPKCERKIQARPEWMGKMMECPECGEQVVLQQVRPIEPTLPTVQPKRRSVPPVRSVQPPTSERQGFAIWMDAARFHLHNARSLAGVLPLLLVPVVGDLLQSVLIRQHVETNRISPVRALRDGWRKILPLFVIKLKIEISALLWGLIPLYGYIKAIECRLRWGMASNVIVFEDLTGVAAQDRCRELIDRYSSGIAVRTLVIVPMLIMLAILLFWVVSGSVFELIYSYGFWFFFITYFWVVIPWAGAANTFVYLQLRNREASQAQ